MSNTTRIAKRHRTDVLQARQPRPPRRRTGTRAGVIAAALREG